MLRKRESPWSSWYTKTERVKKKKNFNSIEHILLERYTTEQFIAIIVFNPSPSQELYK